jgi:ribosome-associated protein
MHKLVNFCDYFVIATGTSSRHVQAISDGIQDGLLTIGQKAHQGKNLKGFGGVQPGQDVGAWVLLDTGAVVVHTFEPNAREFYGLEHLWQDAPITKFKAKAATKKKK